MRLFVSVVICLLAGPAYAQSPYFSHNEGVDPETEQDYAPGFFTELEDLGATADYPEDGEDGTTKLYGPNEDIKAFDPDDFTTSVDLLGSWPECKHMRATGNYTGYQCSSRRVIGERLLTAFDEALLECINVGLVAQGGGTAAKVHLEHAGIMADRNHSPKSNHSIGRAIDVKRISVELQSGGQRTFAYAKLGNRPFYTALRACWGETMVNWNDRPLYRGDTGLTASIGWEDPRHGRHLHLSVPVCYNGDLDGRWWAKWCLGLWCRVAAD